jgi:hypothetical protein
MPGRALGSAPVTQADRVIVARAVRVAGQFVWLRGDTADGIAITSCLCLLKSPFLLLPLMLRPIVGTLLADDVCPRLAPADCPY